ncbi:polymer-forming cytoskeletal protein [Archangium minus]|uniref:Polymer-forming cytoskeletal protein n=1 Tax=Archangium minus TaxID=83450 RepID=A0ABY9WY36_9BACT|nr:polymer-forming cytoskeletal protein [Archangium minus]
MTDKTLDRLLTLKQAYLEKRLWPNHADLSTFLFGFTNSPRPSPDELIDMWRSEGLSILSTDLPPIVTPWMALAHRLAADPEQRLEGHEGAGLYTGSVYVNGDVTIGDGEVLVIGGHLRVAGDIDVAETGGLVVAGTVECRALRLGLHLTALETVRARYVRLYGNDGCLMAPRLECELLHRDDYALSAELDARCEVDGGEFPTKEKALGMAWALRPEFIDDEGELREEAVWEALEQRRPLLR